MVVVGTTCCWEKVQVEFMESAGEMARVEVRVLDGVLRGSAVDNDNCWVEIGSTHLWVFQQVVLWKNIAQVGQGIGVFLVENALEHPPHLLLAGVHVVLLSLVRAIIALLIS